jgi:hypothetical protein
MSLTQTLLDYHAATRGRYQDTIPACCCIRTVEEHEFPMLFCGNILAAIKTHTPVDCTGCPMNQEIAP